MIKSLRIAAVTLLAVGGLAVCTAPASAAVPHAGAAPAAGLVSGPTPFPVPLTGDNPDRTPIGFGPLNVAVPALGVL